MKLITNVDYWTIVGMAGAFLFFSRFVIQWIASEKRKKVHVPVSFWYLSIAGSLLIFVYSVARNDLVFVLAMSLNVFIYVRNLFLHYKQEENADN